MRASSSIVMLGGIFVFTGLFAGALTSCDAQNTYNNEAQQQATTEAAAKERSLQPATGTFCGSVHLIRSGHDYQANLSLEVVLDNQHASTSGDPTDTVQVPKLGGTMTFPVFDDAGTSVWVSYPDLLQATGNYESVNFSYGDYNPATQEVNLPFTIPGSTTGNYGSISGTLDADAFKGAWVTQGGQLVGHFSFTRCSPNTADTDSGDST